MMNRQFDANGTLLINGKTVPKAGLGKEEPKDCIAHERTEGILLECPRCGYYQNEKDIRFYCPNCGQRIK